MQGKTQLPGATTKDEYVAEGREKQGKAQRLTERDLPAREDFDKDGI